MVTVAIPRGGHAVMAQRREPPDSLDYFPTPPWATRALMQHVIPEIGINLIGPVWEPACGEGHIAEVMKEYTTRLIASDVFPYGYGDVIDFLDTSFDMRANWIITNPPFKAAIDFTLLALDRAAVGVAMLCRLQWIEGRDRYERLFRHHPPTLFAPFVERVPMVKGRWDPEASTATSYAWFVWVHSRIQRPPFWIPPCRASLSRREDVRRWSAPAIEAAE